MDVPLCGVAGCGLANTARIEAFPSLCHPRSMEGRMRAKGQKPRTGGREGREEESSQQRMRERDQEIEEAAEGENIPSSAKNRYVAYDQGI